MRNIYSIRINSVAAYLISSSGATTDFICVLTVQLNCCYYYYSVSAYNLSFRTNSIRNRLQKKEKTWHLHVFQFWSSVCW